jgi:YidC/Oxa1 family membrane protein insertase
MQDQGKRLLLAVALAFLVMMVFSKLGLIGKDDKQTGSGAGSATPLVLAAQPSVSKEPECHGGQVETFSFPNVVAGLSSCGGTLVSWQLTDPRYGEDSTQGELVRKSRARTLPNELGDFALNFVDEHNALLLPPDAVWVGKRVSDRKMEYRYDAGDNHIVKTFTIDPDAFMISMSYSGTTGGKGLIVPTVTVFGWQDPDTDTSKNARVQPRVWQSTTYRDGQKLATADLDIGGPEGEPRLEKHVQYTGFEHPYLMTVFAPHMAPDDVAKRTRADTTGAMRTDIELKPTTAGNLAPYDVVGFLGPKNSDLLEHADEVAGFQTGFNQTIDFGHLPLIGVSLSIIGKPLLWLLGKLYGVVGNWGVSIILLTVFVKLLTLFWTTRSMRSMKAMAAVSPQVQEIQKKYGDDKQRAQIETMALYKQHGIRPLAGCAPMFAQIPIWSALYIMLSVTGELYLQPFIPGWIDDLTTSDPYYVLSVALCGFMFVQARLTPQNAAQPGQKMMQYGMPLMFGFFSFWFPAGLTLYVLTNTLLSSVHSIYMNRYDKKSLELVALLKKNKATVEARAKADEDAAKVKAAVNGKPAKSAKPLKVVDAEAVETRDDDEDDVPDAAEAPAVAAAAGGQPRRARRKKRRR